MANCSLVWQTNFNKDDTSEDDKLFYATIIVYSIVDLDDQFTPSYACIPY